MSTPITQLADRLETILKKELTGYVGPGLVDLLKQGLAIAAELRQHQCSGAWESVNAEPPCHHSALKLSAAGEMICPICDHLPAQPEAVQGEETKSPSSIILSERMSPEELPLFNSGEGIV